MSSKRYVDVELPRIKCKSSSWQGQVIEYLLNHSSEQPATDLSMEAITAFWLVEALESKVSLQELNKAMLSAIEKLEGKLATIRRIASLKKIPISYTTSLATTELTTISDENNISKTAVGDDEFYDDSENDLITLKPTEDLEIGNRFFLS